MVLSKPFLTSTLLFSSISPNYEAILKEELWGCHKYMGFSITELKNMTIRDRKTYIRKHNGEQMKKQTDLKNRGSKTSNNTALMNQVARMRQEENTNMSNNMKAAT